VERRIVSSVAGAQGRKRVGVGAAERRLVLRSRTGGTPAARMAMITRITHEKDPIRSLVELLTCRNSHHDMSERSMRALWRVWLGHHRAYGILEVVRKPGRRRSCFDPCPPDWVFCQFVVCRCAVKRARPPPDRAARGFRVRSKCPTS